MDALYRLKANLRSTVQNKVSKLSSDNANTLCLPILHRYPIRRVHSDNCLHDLNNINNMSLEGTKFTLTTIFYAMNKLISDFLVGGCNMDICVLFDTSCGPILPTFRPNSKIRALLFNMFTFRKYFDY